MPAIKGNKHHKAVMNEAKVRAARKAYHSGQTTILVDGKRVPVTLAALAKKYGVAPQTMHAIVTGRTWKHVS